MAWVTSAIAGKAVFGDKRPRGNYVVERTEPRVRDLPAGPTIWFHAASAGELESLWPMISEFSERPGKTVVTAFSPSAAPAFAKLAKLFEAATAHEALFIGFSPLEGGWQQALERWKPDVFVTAKYEAWPELWASLAERKIPLGVVGARERRSLKVASKLCRLLCGELPKIGFLVADEGDAGGLRASFPGASIDSVGEPRWDRVYSRAQTGSPRARELLEWARTGFPRPWGVLGSAWESDLVVWRKALGDTEGTLWVVPHHVKGPHFEEVLEALSGWGLGYFRVSSLSEGKFPEKGTRVLVVDEMGFLSELYGAADWAFVGGGFGAGIHSTIEPALYGIPVASGPKHVERFTETAVLSRSGQLAVVDSPGAVSRWLKRLPDARARREKWKQDAAGRLGAGKRALEAILELASPS
jgi:3-deoxy-D-manno-octulosonic-acid transferase